MKIETLPPPRYFISPKDINGITRKGHNHDAQPSRGTERRIDDEQRKARHNGKVALADMHIEKSCKRNTALKQSAETNTGDLKLVMHDRNIPFPSDTAQNYKNVSDRKGTPTLLKHNKTQMITKLQGNKVEGLIYLCRVDSSTLTIWTGTISI